MDYVKLIVDLYKSVPWHIWLIFLIVGVGALIINRIIIHPTAKAMHARVQEKTRRNPIYIIIVALRYPLRWIVLLAASIMVAKFATFSRSTQDIWMNVEALFFILTIYSYAQGIVKYHLDDILHFLMDLSDDEEEEVIRRVRPLLRAGLRTLFFLIYILALMSFVFKLNINGWLAGLGVLGLGVSLAMQDTFSNFIATIIIIVSKPFKEGQRIVFDGTDGIVEKIGLRGSSIRTLSGHVVTVPNSSLVNNVVENITERPYIKRIMNIGITYDTPQEKITEAVQLIKTILGDTEENRALYENPELTPKVYFQEFDSTQLSILVLYWYHPPNYWDYLEFSQRINEQLFAAYENAGIEFAFPTQTVYLAGDLKRELALKMLSHDLPSNELSIKNKHTILGK